MARGRTPDPDQAAKGHPGRRKSAVRKREEEQQRIADLLLANAGGDISIPPKMIDQGPLYAGAVAVWRELAPRLHRTHRLAETHKPVFAMFCIYYADWVRLNDQLKIEGETQRVKTVSGDNMIRIHPAVKLRQQCFDNLMKLSTQFGLTPVDEYELFRKQSLATLMSPGLFGERPSQKAPDDTDSGAPMRRAGMLSDMNSEPPTTAH